MTQSNTQSKEELDKNNIKLVDVKKRLAREAAFRSKSVPLEVDYQNVGKLTITLRRKCEDKNPEEITKTIREWDNFFYNEEKIEKPIVSEESFTSIEFNTPKANYYLIDGLSIAQTFFRLFILKEFSSSYEWYYVDADHMVDDAFSGMQFFVAYGDKIIEERVFIHEDFTNEGYIANYIFPSTEEPSFWASDFEFKVARAKLSYENFYKQTKTGKLRSFQDYPGRIYLYPEHQIIDINKKILDSLNKNSTILFTILTVVIIILLTK